MMIYKTLSFQNLRIVSLQFVSCESSNLVKQVIVTGT